MTLSPAAHAAILALVLSTAGAPSVSRGEEVPTAGVVHTVVADGAGDGGSQGWLCTLLRTCR